MASVLIEGVTAEEIVALPLEELKALIVTGRPIVFRAGSAKVLGEFGIMGSTLILELAHIDGGGEGVLATIMSIAHRIALSHQLSKIEWLVYATNCARPNPKLRRVLERRGFVVTSIAGKGQCFFLQELVESLR